MVERGKSRMPLVVIAAIFVVIIAYSLISWSTEVEIRTPLYPGAQKCQEISVGEFIQMIDSNVPEDWSGEVYTVPGNTEDITGWYIKQMEGWTLVLDKPINNGHILVFISPGRGVMVTSYDHPQIGTLLGIFSGSSTSWAR